jgi:MFS family permease
MSATVVAATGRTTPLPRRDHRATLCALSVSAIAYGLLQCFAIPALPQIQRELHASANSVSWVLTAFLLTASVATPILGRLGDMYGKARVMLVALGLLAAGTFVSAIATAMPLFLAGRAVQGVSAGVFPLALGIIRDEFPPGKAAWGMGLYASLLGVGSGIGLVLAGPIVDGLGYHWLFWIPLLVTLLAALATWAFVPESPVRAPGRVDWLGGALLSGGLIAVLLAVSRTTSWGWASPQFAVLAALGVALLVAWVWSAARVAQPLVDMRMMRIRGVWTTDVVALLVGVGMYAAFILLPQYVQEPTSTGYGFGATVTQAGIYLLPMPVMLLVVGSLAGRVDHRIGARAALIASTVLSALGWAILIAAHDSPWEIYVSAGLIGAGNGLAFGAMPILITRSVSQGQTGVANGMNNVMRTIGGAVGGQIAATFLAHSAIGGHPGEHGYELAFLTGAVALGLAFVASVFVPRPPTGPPRAAAVQGAASRRARGR